MRHWIQLLLLAGAIAAAACLLPVLGEIVPNVKANTPWVEENSNKTEQITPSVEQTVYPGEETTAPVSARFSNLNTMEVAVGGAPDYLLGVEALDQEGRALPVSYDAGGVDTAQPGVYTVVYTATDAQGNTIRAERTVEVNHTQEDTEDSVAWLAGECGDDPLSVKCYIRDNINYSSNYGAGDPVWYGINHGIGNCYVHALVLQEVLEYKGYDTQLIWTTDKTHYWVLVDLGGCWRHIDATPGAAHGWTELMTDQERLASLDGRTWDQSAWPACE